MTWQCEPGDPRPPFSKSVPSFATMGETRNELRLNKRERGERKGAGVVVKQRGAVNKMPIWEGKENMGTSSHSPCPPDNTVPIPLKMRTHTHTHSRMHTHTPAEEALHSWWGELELQLWRSRSDCFACLFPLVSLFCLRLFLGALSRIYNRPTFTFVKERLFRGCLKFSPMFLCLVAVFCFCWGFLYMVSAFSLGGGDGDLTAHK